MDILCYVGLSICCGSSIDYTKAIGQFLAWQNLLQIAGILFAAVQFMEGSKMRTYIFRWGWLLPFTAWSMGISVVLVAASNFVTLTNSKIPLLSYPATYELAALILLSLLFLAYVSFLLFPKLSLPPLSKKLLDRIRREFLSTQNEDNFGALTIIIGTYLEKLISKAVEVQRHYPNEPEEIGELENEDAREYLSFIDIDMSNSGFVTYLAKNNLQFVLNFTRLAEQYQLWSAGGGIFMDNLYKVLFTDDDSLLSKELRFSGVSGVYKPLSNTLFKSPGLIAHYRVFQSFNFYTANISSTTLQNWTNGLEIALKDYFSKSQNIRSWDSPNTALSVALDHLTGSLQTMVLKIRKIKDDEIWDNEYGSRIGIITNFFQNLENILVQDNPNEEYRPTFSQEEQNAQEGTVTEGVAKALFAYLESFALLDHEEYARIQAIEPMWLLFRDHTSPVLDSIRNKVLELIKERFEENYKGHYHSLIKLMLVIYGGGVGKKPDRNNPIMQHVANEFQKVIAQRLVSDKKFREENLPTEWEVNARGKSIYRTRYGEKEFVYKISRRKK